MGSPTRGQMRAHFDLAIELRDYAILGDLTRFRAAATALSDLAPARDLPAEVHLQLGPTRWEARIGSDARTNEAAAQAAAEIARTCGDCHIANDVDMAAAFVARGAPPLPSDDQHMAGLSRVTGLLWDGLIGPSNRSWSSGARALIDAGALPGALLASFPARDVEFASERLRRLGREAASAQEPAYRVKALAEIWATCSECHARRR